MGFWEAVDVLSEREGTTDQAGRTEESVRFLAAIISLTTLVLAAVPLVLLDPERVDGLPMLLALFLFPMTAGGLIIDLIVLGRLRHEEPRWTLLWWPIVVLPAGLLIMSIGPMLAYPDYFEVSGFSSAIGVMVTFAVLAFLGLGFSFLLWILVVFPLRVLGLAAFDAVRGERVAAGRWCAPLALLAVPTISLLAVASLTDMESSRAAGGQVVLALLGIPGNYEIVWGPGLWIVRGITLAVVGSAIWARGASRVRGNLPRR